MKLRAFAANFVAFVLMIGLISGCTLPIPAATIPPEGGSGAAAQAEEAAMTASNAMATVATRSLRVRQNPDETSEVVAGIAAGETYRVVGLSADGQWIQLAIDSAPSGAGWVSANFVTVEGDITDLANGPDASTPATTTETVATGNITTTGLTLVPTPQPGFAVVNTDGTRLRVRSEPAADAPIVGYAYDGENYQVIATSGDGLWIQIPPATGDNTDNPTGGWVAAEFLIVGQ
jgi:uncharacterized protein YgiM (DUF1202 family)